MPKGSISDLPIEVLHVIVDEVTDNDTLKQCSLVSRSLRPRSQQSLFSSIEVNAILPFKIFVAEFPHLATYVTSLTVAPTWAHLHPIPMLLNVRSLTLKGVTQPTVRHTPPEEVFRVPILSLMFITTIRLQNLANVPFYAISCPNLRDLTLDNVTARPTKPSSVRVHHGLQSLTLIRYPPQDFTDNTSLRWFLANSHGKLTSLAFKDPSTVQSRAPGMDNDPRDVDPREFIHLMSPHERSLEFLELKPLYGMSFHHRTINYLSLTQRG